MRLRVKPEKILRLVLPLVLQARRLRPHMFPGMRSQLPGMQPPLFVTPHIHLMPILPRSPNVSGSITICWNWRRVEIQ
jgi:hypothetical protein